MLLVIDVGNTNIVLGVYDKTELVGHWRISTDRVRTTDEYGMLMMNLFFHDRKVDVKDIKDIIISSVVPPLMPTLERVCLRYFNVNPLIVGPGTKTGIAIKYDNPREVGADRIVNAVAAHELLPIVRLKVMAIIWVVLSHQVLPFLQRLYSNGLLNYHVLM